MAGNNNPSTPSKSSHDAESNLVERLASAREMVNQIGVILPFYTSAIRAINSAPSVLRSTDPAVLTSFAIGSTYMPIKVSPTLSNAFYFAAGELYPENYFALRQSGKPDLRSVLKLFTSNEIAGVLAITYFFRLLKKVCDPEHMGWLGPILSMHLRLGALVGAQTGSNFGRGGGLTAAGIRCLALGVLMKSNPKVFRKLRSLIDQHSRFHHPDFELLHYDCTHLDVASVLAGELGFGAVGREAFLNLQKEKPKIGQVQAVCWNHSLLESENLWVQKQNVNEKHPVQDLSVPPELFDGYKWLWDLSAGSDLSQVELNTAPLNAQTSMEEALEPAVNGAEQYPILLVEDEAVSAKMMEKQLSKLGPITTCADAESALALITTAEATSKFKIVILDVSLPNMNGIELLTRFREIEESTGVAKEDRSKIFMVTGTDEPETVVRAFSNGADGYLTKPVSIEILREELAKYEIEI